MITEHLTHMLSLERDQYKEIGTGAWLLKDFVLRHGKFYQGQCLPTRYRQRTPQACFYNTRSLVLRSKRLRYCEGFAMSLRLRVSFEHAWALDSHDGVIDSTLDEPNLYQFYGITLERFWLRREWRWSGVLRDEIGLYRLEVLKALGPDWMREIGEPWLASKKSAL